MTTPVPREPGTSPVPRDATTSARLKRQKQRDTKPEIIVRRLVHELGVRYRLNARTLPGSPDLSNRRAGWAIFVHGCYWHHHEGCRRATIPRNNRQWWVEKFERNRQRDARKVAELEALGLTVYVVWECETKDPASLRNRLAAALT